MNYKKIKNIKLSLMEALGEVNSKKKTHYIIRSSATIIMNDLVEKTIVEHGIENVLTAIYNDLLKENIKKVDSIGIWVDYNGKIYENSISLKTLDDMKKLSDEEIYPIFELFKLMSPRKGRKISL